MEQDAARRHLQELTDQLASASDEITARQIAKEWYKRILETRSKEEADSAYRLYSLTDKFYAEGQRSIGTSGSGATVQNYYFGSVMGDTYNTSGQVGAVGKYAHAHDMVFQQMWKDEGGSIALPALGEQLSRLRAEIKLRARTAEEDLALAPIAMAEVAAKKGDGASVLKNLAGCGQWAFDVAKEIGVSVAAAVIAKALGLPPG